MKAVQMAICMGTLGIAACTSSPPTTTGGQTGATTSGAVVFPKETRSTLAARPQLDWRTAAAWFMGLPAWAETISAQTASKFQARLNGQAVPVVWGSSTVTASGDTRFSFSFTNPPTPAKGELILGSPSGTLKFATYVESVQPTASASLQSDVDVRTTAAVLVAREAEKQGRKPLRSYTQAEFNALASSGQTASVETSLRLAFGSETSAGTDIWASSSVVGAAAQVAANLSLTLGLNL